MKKLHVNFDNTTDTTGYLFSFAKCLTASLCCSEYSEFADDIIASSGFAFRMWVDGEGLCPSATSIQCHLDNKGGFVVGDEML